MNDNKGFTLIEILIALTLFAILAAITSSTMYYVFNMRNRVSLQAETLNALQLTVARLKQDITQLTQRPIRNHEFQLLPAFIGQQYYLEWTRGGDVNFQASEHRSTLKRVAYVCQNHRLIRRSWPMLDTPNRKLFADKILLDNLDSCHFAFFDSNLQLLNEWRSNLMPNASGNSIMPKAIQFNLSLPNWGKGSFLFIIPAATYE